jgi:hypothetical protein
VRADVAECPPQLLGDEEALRPVRLVVPVRGRVRQQFPVGGDGRAQLGADGGEPVGVTEPAAEFVDAGEVVPQDRFLPEADRVGGDAVRDVRVAVAIATDPRPEAEERRHRPILSGIHTVQRCLDAAVHPRHHVKQPGLHQPEHLLHLVEHGRAGGADGVGEPVRFDLLGDGAEGIRLTGDGRRTEFEPVEVAGEGGELFEHGPPPGLAGVGSEHRHDERPGEVVR